MNFCDVFEDVTKRGRKLQTSEYKKAGKHPIYDQGQNLTAGYTDEENGLYTDVPVVLFGDHTRVVKYIEEPCFLGADGVKLLKSKLPDANIKYLYYAVSAIDIPNTGYNRHFKWLKEAEIKIYDRQEQDRIVGVLDKIGYLVNERKQQLKKLDELVKVRFVEMFGDFNTNPMGWPIVGFDGIAIIDGNMTTDYERYANYPHIGIDSIEKDTGLLRGYRTVAEDGVISGKYVFTSEHIIYSKIRPNLNKVALPDFEGLCSADAYPILPIPEKCNRIFLAYNMRSTYFLDYILQFCNRTNLPKVNRKEISGFKTPLPPLVLQNQFSTFVIQTDKLKADIKASIDRLECLKQSLIKKYYG